MSVEGSSSGVSEVRRILLRQGMECLKETLLEHTIEASFANAGIFPWSPAKVVNDPTKICTPPSAVENDAAVVTRAAPLNNGVLTGAAALACLNERLEKKKKAAEAKAKANLRKAQKRLNQLQGAEAGPSSASPAAKNEVVKFKLFGIF